MPPKINFLPGTVIRSAEFNTNFNLLFNKRIVIPLVIQAITPSANTYTLSTGQKNSIKALLPLDTVTGIQITDITQGLALNDIVDVIDSATGTILRDGPSDDPLAKQIFGKLTTVTTSVVIVSFYKDPTAPTPFTINTAVDITIPVNSALHALPADFLRNEFVNSFEVDVSSKDAIDRLFDNTGVSRNAVDSPSLKTDFTNHKNASSGVHGVVGAVVGTTDTQTLTNKTIVGAIFTGSSIDGTTSDTFEVNTDGNGAKLDTSNLTADRTYFVPDSVAQTLVGDTAIQTLTNKTLTSPKINENVVLTSTSTQLDDAVSKKHTQNTDTGTTSTSFEIGNTQTAGLILSQSGLTTSDKTFTFPDVSDQVTTNTATQTLTNKTLTTPTIASFVNANHSHQNSAGGGVLDITNATTGTLGIARGGTNATSFTASQIVRMNAGGTALESSGKVVPTGTIVGDTDTQTLTNKTLTQPILTLEQGPSVAPTAEGRIAWDTDDDLLKIGDGVTTKTIWPTTSIPSTDTSVVHLAGTETITGSKTFSLAIVADGGLSATGASISFNSKNLTSVGTINTHTIPGGTDTFTLNATAQTLTNKTLPKASTVIDGTTSDDFEVNSDGNGVTLSSTGQTGDHTFTFPDSTQTLVGTTVSQTLTNKTLGSNTVLGANLDAVGTYKVIGLVDPTQAQDAATKAYVDAIISSLDLKRSVRVGTTANITLSGLQTIDGVSLIAGDRVLVKDQTTGSQNGIYDVAVGAWSRSADSDNSPAGEVTAGMFTFVEEGTLNADNGWILTTNNPIVLGTTSLTFTQFSGAGQIIAGAGLTKTGNQLDVGGTTDRITVFSDSVDIAATYVGQSSITTIGTITSGVWNGSTIDVPHGGTGATTFTSGNLLKGNGTGAVTSATPDVDYTTPTGTETLTNKTIDFASNTLTNVLSTNTAQTVSGKKTFNSGKLEATDLKPTGGGTNGHIIPVVADDTLALLTATQTLTNKTIDFAANTLMNVVSTNTIQTISAKKTFNSGDLEATNLKPTGAGTVGHTIPAVADDTITLNAATQTLTNKTIDFGTNTLTNVVSTNTPQTISAKKTFNTGDLEATNLKPTGAGTSGHTIPAVADDTLALLTATQTLTNKTLGASTSLSANLDANSNKVINLTDPTNPQDAATKAYVDATAQNLDIKASVRLATTANIASLTGVVIVDGVTSVSGDRILVKDQTAASQNGIYVAAAGAWARSTDADTAAKVTSGMFVFVEEGTANDNSGWVLTTNNPIVLNTTSLSFTQFSGAGQITAGAGLTKTGNTLDVVGTSGRIDVFADNVDISSTYIGQTSITTLGTITTGTWSGTTIAINKGGTNATSFTANEIVRMNSGGTALESSGKVVPTGTIVGTTDTQTLTNKTITDTGSTTRADRIATSGSSVVISGTAPTAGQVLTASSGTAASWAAPSSSGHTIQDEGTNQTQRSKLNFVGASVTVTDDAGNDATVVSITGGSGSGHTIKDESTTLPQRTYLKFTGSEVTATDDSGNDTTIVEVPITNDITVDDTLVTSDVNGFDQVVTLELVGASPTTPVEDYFVATASQTVFTLSTTPATSTIFFAFINGLARSKSPNNDSTRDYNLTGTTLTFTFALSSGDIVLFKYLS